MRLLTASLRQTFSSRHLLAVIYGITLILGLIVTLPFYQTFLIEDQNSLAFLNLLDGFDFTVYSDFMRRSERTIWPLVSVGRWIGLVYILLSVFFAGGLLAQFVQYSTAGVSASFSVGLFFQACSHYLSRLMGLAVVTLLFVLVGAGLWLVLGLLIGMSLSDTFTERGEVLTGLLFFSLFMLTATFLFCIGDYAKVIMVREDETNPFRAFGRAVRLVVRNVGKTYGLYLLLLLIGTGLFGFYFLIDSVVLMSGWFTIALMFLVQQTLIFARIGLKSWSLGTAYAVYETLPKPLPVLFSQPAPSLDQESISEAETPSSASE